MRPWELEMLHLSRGTSDSSRLYQPRVSSQTQHSRVGDSWAPREIPFSTGLKPTELTKPLLPHPVLRLLRARPSPSSLPVLHWGQLYLPAPPVVVPLLKALLVVTLDSLGAAEPWPGPWLATGRTLSTPAPCPWGRLTVFIN